MIASETVNRPSEDEISRRALEIWEQEGRPEGRALEHWLRAQSELSRRSEQIRAKSPAEPTGNKSTPIPATPAKTSTMQGNDGGDRQQQSGNGGARPKKGTPNARVR
jgi:hypothetical protein